jgi:hypothetical protein
METVLLWFDFNVLVVNRDRKEASYWIMLNY